MAGADMDLSVYRYHRESDESGRERGDDCIGKRMQRIWSI